MNKDDHLINEALADVFKKLNKDQHRAPFAKPGEKQGDCEKGYVLNKDGDCVKKTKKLDEFEHEHYRAHDLDTPGGPLNAKGGVKAYGERAEANPSSTNMAVHGGKTPWGTGPGFPGHTTGYSGDGRLLNAQDNDPYDTSVHGGYAKGGGKRNPKHVYVRQNSGKYEFYKVDDAQKEEVLVTTASEKQMEEWATFYSHKIAGNKDNPWQKTKPKQRVEREF
jgi:hypothetical protein